MSSVQFKSAEKAIDAFKNTSCSAWSVWQSKQLLYKGIGSDDLESFLDLLADGSTNAVYTIAYYEDIADRKSINSKTPFDGSFNFKLNSEDQEIDNRQYKSFYKSSELLSKVNGLEDKFNLLMEKMDGKADSEDENRLGVIGEILDHPAIRPVIPQLLQNVVSKIFATPSQVRELPKMQAVSGVGTVATNQATDNQNITAYQAAEIERAIERLIKADPKLSEHLTKLADMSERDPESFNLIISAFDAK